MLPNNTSDFKGIEFTNTCCICNKQFKDTLGGSYNNIRIKPSCACGVVSDKICNSCKEMKDLKCPKCNKPVQILNVLY